jgi:hypothetical protein
MVFQFSNPFSKIRAEQMGSSIWKYFVPVKDSIGAKPLIYESSRGTGKTMFFICNSWKERLEQSKFNGINTREFLNLNKHIGFYYRVDGRFVNSLNKKNVDDSLWIGIFNTYFNAILTKEIITFLELLIDEDIVDSASLLEAIRLVSLNIEEGVVDNLRDLKYKLDLTLLKVEKFSNDTEREKPVGLNAGTIIEKLIIASKKNNCLKETTFHIFIDEYEVLNLLQQTEINTLLKQSSADIVYDIGVITKGIQTYKTGSGQVISPKDDYTLYSPDGYGYSEKDEYKRLLIDICSKRIEEQFILGDISYKTEHLDISYYLKKYGKKYEIEEQLFSDSPLLCKIKDRVMSEIRRHALIYKYSTEEIDEYFRELTNSSPIILRIHLALLLRRNNFSIPARDLVHHKLDCTRKYKDWIHNTETAAVYLLCNELKIDKPYHGFSVYAALSSGVIRSFLELAEYAFDYAFNNMQNPFQFDKPRELSIEEQTKAVYFVSNFKIKEIDSYEPYGYRLKDFTKALGKIYNSIQTNPNATLGEVEQNHFVTEANELKKNDYIDADTFLKYCIRFKILEEGESTKTKSQKIIEFTDFHLNHIYCPAFKISHLRKRKISISYIDLAKLLCGSHKELEDVVFKLSSVFTEDSAPNLFSETYDLPGEI